MPSGALDCFISGAAENGVERRPSLECKNTAFVTFGETLFLLFASALKARANGRRSTFVGQSRRATIFAGGIFTDRVDDRAR